tara:strand:+ start:6846 stop:7898 length:1053 start_codon:yes stop_codon:yes gene_type:complete
MFFNKKEDVIDIELTQYGKHLFSKGLFQPEYYAFFDDDIIYDSSYANISEVQNDSENRIKEAVRTKTQYVFSGIESQVSKINNLISSPSAKDKAILKNTRLVPSNDRNALISFLGTSEYNNDKAPAWSVDFMKGTMKNYKNVFETTGSQYTSGKIINIPQIESQATYETFLDQDYLNDPNSMTPFSAIQVEEDFLLLQIEEKNTDFFVKNFDIELFVIEEEKDVDGNVTGNEELIPLKFLTHKNIKGLQAGQVNLQDMPPYAAGTAPIIQGSVLDEDEISLAFPTADLDNVEYYFDIETDEEIDPTVLCQYIREKSQGVFSDKLTQCEDIDAGGLEKFDVYSEDDSGEIC